MNFVKATPHSHFALSNHGAPALRVTLEVPDDLHSATVTVEAACETPPTAPRFCLPSRVSGNRPPPCMAGKAVPPAMIQQLNAALNKIKKEG